MDLELSMDINLIPCWLLIQSQLPGAEEWSILTFVNLTSNLVAMTSIDAVWATYSFSKTIESGYHDADSDERAGLKSPCCHVEHLKNGDHKVACCLIKSDRVQSSLIKCTHDVSALYGEVNKSTLSLSRGRARPYITGKKFGALTIYKIQRPQVALSPPLFADKMSFFQFGAEPVAGSEWPVLVTYWRSVVCGMKDGSRLVTTGRFEGYRRRTMLLERVTFGHMTWE